MENATIFVVDDSTIILTQIRDLLGGLYQVRTLNSAATLINLAPKVEKLPDLILLDVEMPDMNGADAIMQIKAIPNWSNIPIILITSWGSDDVLSYLFSLGALDVINKPIVPSILMARVYNYLALYEKQQKS